MAFCSITTGVTRTCDTSVGGVDRVLITDYQNLGTIVYDSNGAVSGWGLSSGDLHEFEFKKGNSSFTQPMTNDNNSFYTQTLTLTVNGYTQENRNAVRSLQLGKTAAVIKTKNGQWLLTGIKGFEATAGDGSTGAAAADLSGLTVTLTSEEDLAPTIVIPEATIEALIA
jgi:hypothetical protein